MVQAISGKAQRCDARTAVTILDNFAIDGTLNKLLIK
jgi:hypothetical protein